jgi:U3 small nucleolar ribonucleoprotein protein LCP5
MAELKEKLQELKIHLQNVKQKLDLETTVEGQSLLQIRICSLLDYIIHLHFFALLKINGKPINEIVDFLIKDRLVLEKTKPLELKLKYQIDKLVKEKIEFKPQPEQMVAVEQPSSNVYKPPKIQPMMPTIKEKRTEKLKKPSKILKDLQDQYDDRPELILDETPDFIAERQRFEEDNFVRLTLSKKERKQRDRIQTDLTNEFQVSIFHVGAKQ